MKRNKKYRIEFAEDGQRCQYDVDALTIAIIPTDGNRVEALRPAVSALWKQFFPGEPPATGQAIEAIAAEFSATPASVVQTALAWHAGKTNQSTTHQEYKNAALEYVIDFFGGADLSAMSPRFDESASEGADIYVEVRGGNANYDVVLNGNLEVLDCQEKLI